MNFLNLLLFLLLLIIAYGIAQRIYGAINKDILEARSLASTQTSRQKSKFNHTFYNRINNNNKLKSHFDRINERLNYCGDPFHFHLTPFRYYCMKIVSAVISLAVLIFANAVNIITILIPVFLFFFVDLCCLYQYKEDRQKVIKEMPNVYSVLEIQSYGDIPFEKSILSLQDIIKFKRLKNAFAEMSAEIVINKDISQALRNFEKKFHMPEIYNFTLTIEQGIETGKIREMLGNQRMVLNRTYLGVKDNETEKNELKVMVCLMLLLVSGSLVTLYSFFYNIAEQLKGVFNF